MCRFTKVIKFVFHGISFRFDKNECLSGPAHYSCETKFQNKFKAPVLFNLLGSFVASLLLVASPSYAQKLDPSELNDQDIEQTEYSEQDVELNIQGEGQGKAQLSRELQANLNAQFEKIQTLIKTENSYSARLGEEYLNYGLLLKQAGEIDEARENIVDALHISKVNDGVYGIEQRPILRELFEINLLLAKSEELEENLAKINWLENKHPKEIGTYSFDLVLKLGHHFLDRYSIQSIRSEASLAFLDTAAKYFSFAIRKYGANSMDTLLMPYGELSEVHYYRSRLIEKVRNQRDYGTARGGRRTSFERLNQTQSPKFFDDTFSKTEFYSKLHLTKARDEKNQTEIVNALLAIADSNLLFKRKKTAAEYYQLAWNEAQKLPVDDPIRLSFNKPVKLPAFKHSFENEEARRQGATYAVLPVIVNVDANGKVILVEKNVAGAVSERVASRARRIIRNTKFRPVIADGKMLASDQHKEMLRVLVKKNG